MKYQQSACTTPKYARRAKERRRDVTGWVDRNRPYLSLNGENMGEGKTLHVHSTCVGISDIALPAIFGSGSGQKKITGSCRREYP